MVITNNILILILILIITNEIKSKQTEAHTTELQLRACVCGESPTKKIWAIYPKTSGHFTKSYNFGAFLTL